MLGCVGSFYVTLVCVALGSFRIGCVGVCYVMLCWVGFVDFGLCWVVLS